MSCPAEKNWGLQTCCHSILAHQIKRRIWKELCLIFFSHLVAVRSQLEVHIHFEVALGAGLWCEPWCLLETIGFWCSAFETRYQKRNRQMLTLLRPKFAKQLFKLQATWHHKTQSSKHDEFRMNCQKSKDDWSTSHGQWVITRGSPAARRRSAVKRRPPWQTVRSPRIDGLLHENFPTQASFLLVEVRLYDIPTKNQSRAWESLIRLCKSWLNGRFDDMLWQNPRMRELMNWKNPWAVAPALLSPMPERRNSDGSSHLEDSGSGSCWIAVSLLPSSVVLTHPLHLLCTMVLSIGIECERSRKVLLFSGMANLPEHGRGLPTTVMSSSWP